MTILTRIEGNRARRLRIAARNYLLWSVTSFTLALFAATGAAMAWLSESGAWLVVFILFVGGLFANGIRTACEFRRHLDLHQTELHYQPTHTSL